MCGICEIVNINKQPVNLSLTNDMVRIMRHRGPDDEGIYHYKNVGMGLMVE